MCGLVVYAVVFSKFEDIQRFCPFLYISGLLLLLTTDDQMLKSLLGL